MKKVYCVACKIVHQDENGKITFEHTTVYCVCENEEKAISMLKDYVKYDNEHVIKGISRHYKIDETYMY